MAQFGAKNSWARGTQHLNPQLLGSQLGGVNAFTVSQAAALQSLGAGLGVIPSVSAAAFTTPQAALANAVGLRNAQTAAAALVAQQQQKNQRAFIGTVTKLQEQYGFIDDDVFFKTDVVRGPIPRIGDKVMVEAAYNPSMPFKWNAFRVQILPSQEGQSPHFSNSQQPLYRDDQWSNNEMLDSDQYYGQQQYHQGRQSYGRSDERSPPRPVRRHSPVQSSGPPSRRPASPHASKKSPPSFSRRRSPSPARQSQSSRSYNANGGGAPLKREHSPPRKSPRRSVSRSSRSPPRRKSRVAAPRYAPHLPKFPLEIRSLSVYDVHKRYNNLYLPSDFFQAHFYWPDGVSPKTGFSFQHPVSYTIMHKDVDDPLPSVDATIAPLDANYRHTVRVMLISLPSVQELYRKVIGSVEDQKIKEDFDPVNPQKVIQFLVGSRNKNESVAVGGPWSPSLDGRDPEKDPQVLIRTAIRTTKALCGIDLSKCSVWLKFLEIRYRRSNSKDVVDSTSDDGYNSVTAAGNLETVTFFVPDVWSVQPNEAHFSQMQGMLKEQLNSKLAALDEPPPPVATVSEDGHATAAAACEANKSSVNVHGAANDASLDSKVGPGGGRTEVGAAGEDAKTEVFKVPDQPVSVKPNVNQKGKPTPWDQLDVKTMKVPELKAELEARDIEAKGVKSQLVSRLEQVLKEEQEGVENQMQVVDSVTDESETPPSEQCSKDEPSKLETGTKAAASTEPHTSIEAEAEKRITEEKDARKRREREEKERKETKKDLERHYALSSLTSPAILVYPNKVYKNGKYECKLASLYSLLDYKSDDNSEYAFEMAVFAETFREMMMRDGAYNVYKILSHMSKKEEQANKEKAAKADEKASKEGQKTDASNEKTEELSQKVEKADDSKMFTEEAVTDKSSRNDQASPDNDNKDSGSKSKSATQPDEKDQKKAAVPCDPQLALSLAIFDTTRCGYLHARDVEEILYSLSLRLTKGQIQKLIKCIPNRDELNYKKLGFSLKDIDVESLDLQGNIKLAKSDKAAKQSAANAATTSGVISFRGKIVDVGKSLKQIERLDEEKVSLEQRCALSDKEIKKLKEQRDLMDKKRRWLEDDLRGYKKRLFDAEKCLKTSQDDTEQLKTSLLRCKDYSEQIGRTAEKMLHVKRESSKTPASSAASPKESSGVKDEKPGESALTVSINTAAEQAMIKKEDGKKADRNQLISANENDDGSKAAVKEESVPMECDNVITS